MRFIRPVVNITSRSVLRSTSRTLFSAPFNRHAYFSTSQPLSTSSSSKSGSEPLREDNASAQLGTTKRLPEFSLKGKVVCISGAARGLGLVQAEALLEAGATVYALDRLPDPSPDFARVEKRAREELDTSLTYHKIDVRNEDELNKIIESIATKHGRMDGLIAAAGIVQETEAIDYSSDDFNMMMSINVTGVFTTAQAVARQMMRFGNGGSIVLIASMSGTITNKGLPMTAYNTSKSGVLQLGRSLAAEWGEHKIRVNTISPGYIYTVMTKALFERFPERNVNWPKENMLNRISVPQEYRGAAVFLVSDASSFMTGADLRIDGGHCAW